MHIRLLYLIVDYNATTNIFCKLYEQVVTEKKLKLIIIVNFCKLLESLFILPYFREVQFRILLMMLSIIKTVLFITSNKKTWKVTLKEILRN